MSLLLKMKIFPMARISMFFYDIPKTKIYSDVFFSIACSLWQKQKTQCNKGKTLYWQY